jgi:hypothetical protein
VSEPAQSGSYLRPPRAIIPRDDIPFSSALPQAETERLWHDPSLVLPRERQRNLRHARLRRKQSESGEEYCSPERQADLERERPALSRQIRNRASGDPSRAVPLAFDERGDFVAPLAGRVPERQAEQARLLLESGLAGKARRQAWCRLIGRRRDCFSGDSAHRFFTPCLCGNRYCPFCGPKSFRDLFSRHVRLRVVVENLFQHRPADHRPRVLAKIDFTTPNRGEMPSAEEVRRFNKDIRRFFRAIERRLGVWRKDYGALWCTEFGSGNTNLHAHGLYCGPELPQSKLRKELSALWSEIRGERSFVSIKHARSFEAALGHALKYPSKFFNASPGRLVELEVAFHRVRRVHALAAFYNPKIEREPGEDESAEAGRCPICGHVLLDAPGWFFVADLEREGCRDTGAVRAEVARAKVLADGLQPP